MNRHHHDHHLSISYANSNLSKLLFCILSCHQSHSLNESFRAQLSNEDIRCRAVERWQQVLSTSLDEVTSQEDDLSNDEKQVITIMRKFVKLLCDKPVSEAISTTFQELSLEV